MVRTLLTTAGLIVIVLHLGACDRRTAEEKGRDFAKDRIGFVEGAADVLKEKGKGVGEAVGTGVGGLVKGAGSAIKDTVSPPVTVQLGPTLADAGLAVLRGNETDLPAGARGVTVHLQFAKTFDGRLELAAMSTDSKLGTAVSGEPIAQTSGSERDLVFSFPASFRLSKVDHYVLGILPPKAVRTAPPLAGLALSQLGESGHQVSLYVRFEKGFRGGLQLRAYDERGQELGRSEPTTALTQDPDSAAHFAFAFDEHTPMQGIASYSLHKATPKPPPPKP